MTNFKVKYSDGVLHPEWAYSWSSKAIGLRGKRSGCKMFVFTEDSKPLVDMIGVRCSLLIVFISEGLKVLETRELEPGFNFAKPEKPCKYVLEDSTFPDISEGEELEFLEDR